MTEERAYWAGFETKCAQYGVDPGALVKAAQEDADSSTPIVDKIEQHPGAFRAVRGILGTVGGAGAGLLASPVTGAIGAYRQRQRDKELAELRGRDPRNMLLSILSGGLKGVTTGVGAGALAGGAYGTFRPSLGDADLAALREAERGAWRAPEQTN